MAQLKTVMANANAMIATRKSYIFTGPPGIGKSAMVEQIAKARGPGFGFAVIMGPTLTPMDVNGFLFPSKAADGKPIAVFTRPVWMQTRDGRTVTDFPDGGILFIDEWGQADPDTKRALADLIHNRRVGQHSLPDNWVVWAASNRVSDRSGVTREFDFLVNRVCYLEIQPDMEGLLTFLSDRGAHHVIQGFVKQNPQLVFQDKVPDKQGPWCTPRSIVNAGDALMSMSTDDGVTLPTDAFAVELVTGFIGAAATAQLMAFVRLGNELPTFEEVLQAPTQANVPNKPDAKVIVAYALAARASIDNIAQLLAYIGRIPEAEFQALFIRSAVRKAPQISHDASYTRWIAKNAALAGTL